MFYKRLLMVHPTSVFINSNNWLEIILGSKIMRDDYLDLISKVYDLSLVIEDKDLPVNLLVDCSHQDYMEDVAEELAVRGTRDLNFSKIASFKLNPKFIPLLGKILKEIHGGQIKNFDSREEAEQWLSKGLDSSYL